MIQKHHIAFNDIVQSLEDNKNRVALIDKQGKEHTYHDFKRNITGARAELVKRGVKKGSKVLVFVTMSLELYAILEALFSIGAKTIFLDPWMKGRKMGAIIKQVEPDLMVLSKKVAKYSWLLPSTWRLKKWKLHTIQPNDDDWKINPVEDNDSALITFTSGTGGNPKGANRTYEFIDAQAQALKARLQGNEGEHNVDYTNLPIVALAGFAIGNTVVIPRINLMKVHKAEPEELIDHLIAAKITRMVVSPSLLKKILVGIKLKGKGDIKEIVTGGAPISNTLIMDCIDNHPDIFFESIYGSTEVEPISSSAMKDIYSKIDEPLKGVYVGKPVENLSLKIINTSPDNIDVSYLKNNELSESQIGEVIVSGGHVNKNYYQNPVAIAKYKITDEHGEIWHRTGDIAYLENGEIYLVGRAHRVIERAEKKYYPFPVEQFIEYDFGFTDIGYIQKKNGDIVLYIGSGATGNIQRILKKLNTISYPCDDIVFMKKELPRDARHKSKLQTESLS